PPRLTPFPYTTLFRSCEDCRRRIETNPLRALDCKQPGCVEATADAPASHEHLCGACKEHFDRVVVGAQAMGVPYTLDGRLVRGLDRKSTRLNSSHVKI